jgi:hypothetical protein
MGTSQPAVVQSATNTPYGPTSTLPPSRKPPLGIDATLSGAVSW